MPQSYPSGTGASGEGDKTDLLTTSSLPEWVIRTLLANGVSRLSELSEMTDTELLGLRGVGQRSVRLIRLAIVGQRRRRKLGLIEH